VNREEQFPRAAPAVAAEELRGTVLIVDDDVFIRNALQLYLETLGYNVQVAENGERALEVLADPLSAADLVILDLVLPGLSGLELLKVLKSRDPVMEVIITTGCGSVGTAIEALRHGAFDYITKPIVNFDDDFLKVVQEALRVRRQKLKQSVKSLACGEEGARERLLFLDRAIDLAAAANRAQKGEPVLERIEELLERGFAVSGGLVLGRDESDQPASIYSWGFSCPLAPRVDRPLESELAGALREGAIRFIPVASLDPGWVGVASEDLARWVRFVCMPLLTHGDQWGSLLLFFESESALFSQPPERNPFQILVPILSPIIAEALHFPRRSSMLSVPVPVPVSVPVPDRP
jgi:FixJ family two-component response regulator